MQLGIKETKELVDGVLTLAVAVDKSLADGKLSYQDLPLMIEPVGKLSVGFEGIEDVKLEIKDLDASERQELIELVKEKLVLESARTEEIIEKSISVALNIYDIIQVIKK